MLFVKVIRKGMILGERLQIIRLSTLKYHPGSRVHDARVAKAYFPFVSTVNAIFCRSSSERTRDRFRVVNFYFFYSKTSLMKVEAFLVSVKWLRPFMPRAHKSARPSNSECLNVKCESPYNTQRGMPYLRGPNSISSICLLFIPRFKRSFLPSLSMANRTSCKSSGVS